MLSDLMENYEDLIPDLSEIRGLGLNWDQLFDCCNDEYPYPNFGMDDLYSIGDSGHEYLVFCPRPGLSVDEYPIAHFNEETGTSRIVASSIKNWFPCYLIHRIDTLFSQLAAEDDEEGLKEEAAAALDGILKDRLKIEKFAEEFGNKEFNKLLPKIFDAVKTGSVDKGWDFAGYLRIADGATLLADAVLLERKNAPADKVKAFVKKNPGVHKGIYLLFRDPQTGSVKDCEPEEFFSVLDKDLANRIISSPVTADLGGRFDIYRILKAAAHFLRQDESYEESPFAGLIDELYDSEDPCIAHLYYEAGIVFANDGDIERALACCENALFFSWAEEETFYADAFEEIQFLAPEFKDKNYIEFIRSLRFVDDEPSEEEDDEEDEDPDFAPDGLDDDDEEEEDEPEDEDDEEEDDDDDRKPVKKTKPKPKSKKK